MTITTTPLILIKQDKTYFKQRSNTNMEAIIDFYIYELKNNSDLSRSDREKYLDFINSYTLEILRRM